MRLGEDVLLEIVNIVLEGLSEGKDISQKLRDIDLDWAPEVANYSVDPNAVGLTSQPLRSKLMLSSRYVTEHPRRKI